MSAIGRIPLAGGWTTWSCVCLRGAGFPIGGVIELGSDALWSAAKRIDQIGAAAFDELATVEQRQIAERMRNTAQNPRFREALAWQNRDVLRLAIHPLSTMPDERTDSKARQRREALAKYVQRYAAKNDTIGFFGPVGWAELDEGPDAITGETVGDLDQRRVSLEHWAVDAIARSLERDGCPPRRHPVLAIDGQRIRLPDGRSASLPRPAARVLASCDGERAPREIAAATGLPLETVAEILAMLAERGAIFWALEIPVGPDPDRALASALARMDAGAVRTRGEEILLEMTSLVAEISREVGDPDAVASALDELDRRFEGWTGSSSRRRAGETYAGRSMAYEDCRRSGGLRIGRPVVCELGPPMALLLESARWYTHELAARGTAACLDAFRANAKGGAAPFLELWSAVAPMFRASPRTSLVEGVRAELQARWARILAIDDRDAPITLRSQEIEGAVRDAFAAPGPGWPGARHHSPDVLIAADGADAIRRGDYTFVLGEIHVAMSSMLAPFFVAAHPDPRALVRAREEDITAVGLRTVPSRDVYHRGVLIGLSPRDVDMEVGATKSPRPRDHVVGIGDLVAVESGSSLEIRSMDGRFAFDLAAVLEDALMADAFSSFEIIRSSRHTPRIAIDRLVVHREAWTLASEEIEAARAKTPPERLRAILQWALHLGIPRFVFVRCTGEAKPFFVDFASPPLVEVFAKAVRQSTTVTIAEMLPRPDQCWLSDRSGARYSAELRMIAVDPIPHGARHD